MDAAGAAERRRSLTILALAVVAFVALLICGLGVTSLLLDQSVIPESGLSQLPGVLGSVSAAIGFGATTYPALRRRAGVAVAVLAGFAAAFGYLLGVAVGALLSGADPLRALGVAGRLAVSWPTPVVGVAAILCAASALVVVRAGEGRARWPWEREGG